jgi:hypothetical protein
MHQPPPRRRHVEFRAQHRYSPSLGNTRHRNSQPCLGRQSPRNPRRRRHRQGHQRRHRHRPQATRYRRRNRSQRSHPRQWQPARRRDAIRLARRTLRTIKGNLFSALAYDIAALRVAASGYLNRLIAGAAIAFSSVFVVSNSLRLRRFSSARRRPPNWIRRAWRYIRRTPARLSASAWPPNLGDRISVWRGSDEFGSAWTSQFGVLVRPNEGTPASARECPRVTAVYNLDKHSEQFAGVSAKPSDGLEPSTPSLPWRCSTD